MENKIPAKIAACQEEFLSEVITSIETLCTLHKVDRAYFMEVMFPQACVAIASSHFRPKDIKEGTRIFRDQVQAIVTHMESKK